MSLLSRLFGGGGKSNPKSAAPSQDYSGFVIFVEPMPESGGHRVAARIEKDIDGTLKTHHMIRADVCSNLDEANETSLLKAKSLIDQQGDAIFRD